ncbi:methyl-accepting chemotaxis protein [Pelomonas sp. KK5]|uniref:methyl-accepting chemotaxis protein n=1 Tax=Pelomonas sp. KK5 TaxID=1855730 RepID=UPI00097BAFDF|nr:CHASE3 domain-containing protein [Pelomonas sp. KK5]
MLIFGMWTFGKKLALGFGLSFLILLLVGVSSYQGVRTLTRTSYEVAHSHEVLNHIGDLLSALKDAETGQRGFVLTGADDYLEPYNAAHSDIPRLVAELQRLVVDNPSQSRLVVQAAGQIAAIMKLHAARIEERRSAGLEASLRSIRSGEGKRLMDDLRLVFGEVDRAEEALLQQRAAVVESAASGIRMAITWGTVIGLLLVCGAGMTLAHSLKSQIGAAVDEVQRSSTELQAASLQQSTGARETSTAMAQVAATTAELMQTSREISESALHVVDIAGRTAGAARSGDQLLQAADASIHSMREQIRLVVEHMLNLGRKSRQIDAILDLVVELADQTNILATNATIEAIGAGEHGRRFGVVADEVRKLADRMSATTKGVRQQIEEVRGAVDATMRATQVGSEAVDAGVSQFGSVTAAFVDIGAMVVRTNDAARQIELSTQQQATAAAQLNDALSHTARAARETEASSTQTSQTATRLVDMSHGLKRLIAPTRQGAR